MTGRNTVKDWHIPFFRYGPIDGETELERNGSRTFEIIAKYSGRLLNGYLA
jgi:hypothetical protein